jgi:hypothetical protein
LLRAAAAGDLLDLGEGQAGRAEMQAWGPERTVRAAVIRHLLVGREWPVHPKGVRLRGARVSGVLDLEGTAVPSALRLADCLLDTSAPVTLDHANVRLIALTGCSLAGLSGEALVVANQVDLSRSTLTGPLRLTAAVITGSLVCRATQLLGAGPDGRSFEGGRMKVGGDVVLAAVDEWTWFSAAGAVVLDYADVAGALVCTSASLGTDADGVSLSAEGIKVGSHVELDGERAWFAAAGTVRLSAAEVAGTVDCTGAHLATEQADDDEIRELVGATMQVALEAERIRVGDHLILDSVRATGAVLLAGSTIAGDLRCSAAHLDGINDSPGYSLHAAGITVGGSVALNDGFTSAGTISLHAADIAAHLSCQGATLGTSDNEYNALLGDNLKVGGNVAFDHSAETMTPLVTKGGVRLAGAHIGGQLIGRGAQLGPDGGGSALIGDGLNVGLDVLLDRHFTAKGTVRLPAARISGDLVCTTARLAEQGGEMISLLGDGMKVDGSVRCDTSEYLDRFTAAYAVSLRGAEIGSDVVFRGADLTGADEHDVSLHAEGMKVGGSLWLDTLFNDPEPVRQKGPFKLEAAPHARFTAAGRVVLRGARIAGDLNCHGATLEAFLSGAATALAADSVTVGGDVVLDRGFTAGGALSFRSAQVGGMLRICPSALGGGQPGRVALDAAGARVSRALVWRPGRPVRGQVSLESAVAGQLEDDWTEVRGQANGYWPAGGQLRLAGFSYGGFGGIHPVTLGQRLGWIRSQYPVAAREGRRLPATEPAAPRPAADTPAPFASQPYEQLAQVYRQAGQDQEARAVAIARRRDLRHYGKLSRLRRAGNWMLDVTISYGYRPLRAVIGLLTVLAVTAVALWIAQHHTQLIVPTLAKGLSPAPTALRCTASYPCFYPVGYAIDTVVPIINVHQAQYWGLGGRAGFRWAWVAGTWLATGCGWAFATLAVAGYTGLVRNVDAP